MLSNPSGSSRGSAKHRRLVAQPGCEGQAGTLPSATIILSRECILIHLL
jgi:hypothetical protein